MLNKYLCNCLFLHSTLLSFYFGCYTNMIIYLLLSQSFNHTKMEWPINYSLEKMLPLLTLYSLSRLEKGVMSPDELTLRPEKIVKQRVRHAVPCLEILWQIDGEFNCSILCLCLQCAWLSRQVGKQHQVLQCCY